MSSLSLSNDNGNKNKLEEKTAILLLEKIRQQYPLEILIDSIISETTKPERKIIGENKNNDLNNIIKLIYEKIGAIAIFKWLLGKENKNPKEKALTINIEEKDDDKNKGLSLSSTSGDDFIEINNDINYINNNIININEDDEKMNETIINITDNDDNFFENTMKSLYEKENIFENKEKRLELKIKNNINNKDIFSLKKFQMKSPEKCIIINKINNLDYHCSLINGNYYKYKLKSINNHGIAKFICINHKCLGYGVYNTNNKLFTLLRGHSIDNSCSNINMDIKDKIFYSYMKYHHIEEMQLTNN